MGAVQNHSPDAQRLLCKQMKIKVLKIYPPTNPFGTGILSARSSLCAHCEDIGRFMQKVQWRPCRADCASFWVRYVKHIVIRHALYTPCILKVCEFIEGNSNLNLLAIYELKRISTQVIILKDNN